MELGRELQYDKVDESELLARIVLDPKDIDKETGYPKESFISLRNEEEGISFLRFDYLGEDDFQTHAIDRESFYNKNKRKKKYTFVGWMQGVAQNIKALAPDVIELTVDNPQTNPEHVNVRFHKNNQLIKGIVTDAEILDILDELYHLLKYVKV